MPPLGNRVYKVLKYSAQIVLPALATLYSAISMTWGLPFTEEIVTTITAVNTFFGVVLGVTMKAGVTPKYDGVIKIDETDDKKTFSLVVHEDPHKLDEKDVAVFKIDK